MGQRAPVLHSDAELADARRGHALGLWIRDGRSAAGQRGEPASPAQSTVGREATESELRLGPFAELGPISRDRDLGGRSAAHFNSPSAGARVAQESIAAVESQRGSVQMLVSDGLSAEAIHQNLPDVLPTIRDGLASHGLDVGRPLLARYGRVKLAEHVGELTGADLVIHLIGERPGGDASASRSMSAYLVYCLRDPAVQRQAAEASGNPQIRHEYTVISNIHDDGLPALEAGAVIVERVLEILAARAAGNRLETAGPGKFDGSRVLEDFAWSVPCRCG